MTSSAPWTRTGAVTRRGLRDDVHERILELLLSQRLEPGTRLSIDGIAKDLEVSPTPVREALIHLERTGLVERVALKGYRVAPPLGHDQVDALFDARLVIECGAVELASAHSQLLVPALEQVLDLQRRAAGRLDVEGGATQLNDYSVHDWRFHELIFEHTGNTFLMDMSETITARVHRMRQIILSGRSDAHDAVREHEQIASALKTGSPEAAAAAMRTHLQNVRHRAHSDANTL